MQCIYVGKRETVPESARSTRLKQDEDLFLLDHRMANASQEVRLADPRPTLDDDAVWRNAVAQPAERIQDPPERGRVNAIDVDDVVAPNVSAGMRCPERDVPECFQL